MSVLAYHYVSPDVMPDVLAAGRLKPALERLDPYLFEDDCAHEIEDLVQAVGGTESDVVMMNEHHFREFVEREIKSLSDFQRQEGFRVERRATQLRCLDFLAGDIEYVFLKPLRFPSWASGSSGFAFDAYDLLQRGAGLRLEDLIVKYETAAMAILKDDHPSTDAFGEALTQALREVQRNGTLKGASALRALRPMGTRGRSFDAEIVWEGPLDLSWAVVAWNGTDVLWKTDNAVDQT